MSKLFTVNEVSKALGVNKNYVYELIKHGHIQALKLGSLKVTSYELDDFIKRNSDQDFTDLNNVKKLEVI